MRVFAIVSLSVLAAWPAELPVRQVVLYKHGIGYFERSGKLGPGESARLDFKSSEMDDVLKSLTIEERGGGKVSGLRYDSMDPLSHKLADFPFQIAPGQPLSVMLDQLKGARIELKFGAETVAGAIVNGRLVPGSDRQAEREQLTLMLDTGDLRSVDLTAASAIRFPDPQLQGQFKDYLAALAASRSKDKRSVYVDSTGAREREIFASYTIPSAVWKSSYRLLFAAEGDPTLEGWAIVDNTSGEDWDKVELSLVSGRPISFVSRLYAPRYVSRPVAELPEDRAAAPVMHEGSFEEMRPMAGLAAGQMGAVSGADRQVDAGRLMAPAPMAKQMAMGGNAAEAQRRDMAAPSSIVANAAAQELGELFEYRIGAPVNIRKDESAMLPFLQQKLTGRKLLIYSDHSSAHPTNAAELTNNSGKTLDGGPVTIYDGGAYGGEALMETLKAGDKRLISYAVDLGTRVTEAFDSKEQVVREIHARRGIVTTKVAAEETRTYTVRNVDQKVKTLIVEHPLRQGYTLLNQKPLEKTPSAYRFELKLAAGASSSFPVSEERVFDQSVAVANVTPDLLLTYIRNKNLTEAGRKQLQQIADQKAQLAATAQSISEVETKMREISADEDRVRRNIDSLNRVSGQQQQVQTYARQLDTSEQQLATLRDRQAVLQTQRGTQQAALNKLIEALEF